MNQNLESLEAVHTHTHTHRYICIINKEKKEACKIEVASVVWYTQNLIRDE